jgi:cytochrome c oxidase subunit 3
MLGVGMVVWLASELMFFAGLFAAWFALRGQNDPWQPEGVELETLRTALATAVLVASSLTLHAGERAAHAGDRRRAGGWVLITAALGLAFLANQALEYAGLDFSVSDHAYGTLFYTLTGFHGLHVLGGIALMLVVLLVGTGRGTRAPLDESLTVTAYYWHFVDAVWVAMFATIYLLS